MYRASVLPVMIASPSDVNDERTLIRDQVHRWNFTDAFSKRVVLLPVSWETHASPELGKPAQEQINARLLEKCDILVGIFWTRIGTPTTTDLSGTAEEIRRHMEAGKPSLVYFCDRPVHYDSVNREQYEVLLEFKEWCRNQGLYHQYDQVNDLKDAFSDHLRHCMNENEYLRALLEDSGVSPPEPSAQLETVSFPEDAVNLLRSAAESDGTLILRQFIGGFVVQAGRSDFKGNDSQKEFSKWKAMVEKLEQHGLIEERSFGSGLYFVTHEGYEALDRNRQN